MKYVYLSILSLLAGYVLVLVFIYFNQRNLLYHPAENNYLKDKGRTYAEFKENLKDSGSGIAAIEKMLGKPEALKFLAGDIYNAVIDSEKFVIGGKLSRQANETTQDFKQRYAEKELPLEKWNKITEGNQTFGNKTETKEYRNTTKIGTKFAREYYDKLSENDKAKVRQDVIDFVVRGSGYRPIVAGGGLGTKKQAKLEDQEKKKIVIISLVRSNSDAIIGFLKDYRRMNVAMTRAKEQLVVIGDSTTIGQDKFFAQFLEYMEEINGYKSAWELMG